ncbi:hypothetical protein RISK_001929 [Rhodopirellula islandica]|uniref:Uncharacterized protein n=1 Tax=Rhodopirellula islandica TaxID=595434 RepID=A0A0J1BHW9_RHOIS|nr:hypothetical protein RISK_001929 [Rhodopirellula islandica]
MKPMSRAATGAIIEVCRSRSMRKLASERRRFSERWVTPSD